MPQHQTHPLKLQQTVRANAKRSSTRLIPFSAGAEATLKRFWKHVDIEPHGDGLLAITLDKRPLKTPSGHRLLVPERKRLVATLIASEWDNQASVIKHHALPMV